MIILKSGRSSKELRPFIKYLTTTTLIMILSTLGLLQLGYTMARTPPFNKFFISGETHLVTKCVFGDDKSVCKISQTETKLDGTSIYCIPNVATEKIEIEFFINTGYIKFKDKTINKNPIFEIQLDKNIKLNRPVKISIPFHDKNDSQPITGLYIKEDGSLSTVLTSPPELYDDQVKRFSIYTFHSGVYSWVAGPL